MKKLMLIVISLALMLLFVSCGNKNAENQAVTDNSKGQEKTSGETASKEGKHPMVTISVKDYGDMVFELYSEDAPITVDNFIKLANKGFYEAKIFHRVYKGFMIQGGSSDGMGYAGSDETIKGEFSSNGVNNSLSHVRGVISMARSPQDPDSASSQFFICDADSTFLDGSYAAFGKLVEGFDVLDKIADTEVTYNSAGEKSSPLVPPVISKVVVNK
ncbi:MAG: peptidylprolyl isomerase [Bacillota bacterium]|nr:peptidylprolyl isomerase [Bacillota bacterium]